MITTIDNIESYLGQYLGKTKILLAYIIRENDAVLPEAADPMTINYATK
jgi:hypothetical protein